MCNVFIDDTHSWKYYSFKKGLNAIEILKAWAYARRLPEAWQLTVALRTFPNNTHGAGDSICSAADRRLGASRNGQRIEDYLGEIGYRNLSRRAFGTRAEPPSAWQGLNANAPNCPTSPSTGLLVPNKAIYAVHSPSKCLMLCHKHKHKVLIIKVIIILLRKATTKISSVKLY